MLLKHVFGKYEISNFEEGYEISPKLHDVFIYFTFLIAYICFQKNQWISSQSLIITNKGTATIPLRELFKN